MPIPALYHWSISAYQFAVRLSACTTPKARLWIEGRKNWRQKLRHLIQESFTPGQPRVWIHVSSLGEFEQGRPIIESLKNQYPNCQLLLSFFSPSGFVIRQHYPLADGVCYLPADTPANARDFVDIVQPNLAIFVKYELWLNILSTLQLHHIPTYLISASFRPGQYYFSPFGKFARLILQQLDGIFVQQESSRQLLQQYGFDKVWVAGDTRVDRVISHAASIQPIPVVAQFCQQHPVLIAGSTWAADEQLLASFFLDGLPADWKIIIAPHEIDERSLQRVEKLFPKQTIRYSEADQPSIPHQRILLIDNMGMLASLYQYGRIAYIGGGFGQGIHNTLEPMAFHIPVIFGPRYQGFEEARAMTAAGAACSVRHRHDLARAFQQLTLHHGMASAIIADYLKQQAGATQMIMQQIRGPLNNLS
jgi:3-deoxy-D-manno-octulosonic-acid transferase